MDETKPTPGPWRVTGLNITGLGKREEVDRTPGFLDTCVVTGEGGNLVIIAEESGHIPQFGDYLPGPESAANMKTGLNGPCTLRFLDKTIHCASVDEAITESDKLMAEEFPDVYAAIAAATSEVS